MTCLHGIWPKIGKISIILTSCNEDVLKTRLGKKFKWRYSMTYSKCESHKALLLKKDVGCQTQKIKCILPVENLIGRCCGLVYHNFFKE